MVIDVPVIYLLLIDDEIWVISDFGFLVNIFIAVLAWTCLFLS